MNAKKSFGETIKYFRKENNLTLREVAKNLEMDISLLSKIEKNSRKPSKQLIKNISKLFNVSERELTIAHLSDNIVYSIIEEDLANEALKVAEDKINYIQKNKTTI